MAGFIPDYYIHSLPSPVNYNLLTIRDAADDVYWLGFIECVFLSL